MAKTGDVNDASRPCFDCCVLATTPTITTYHHHQLTTAQVLERGYRVSYGRNIDVAEREDLLSRHHFPIYTITGSLRLSPTSELHCSSLLRIAIHYHCIHASRQLPTDAPVETITTTYLTPCASLHHTTLHYTTPHHAT